MTTTHKTLAGARGGMILCKEEFAKKIDSAVFPGHQGGPLMHVIAGKAVTLKIAQTDLFRERQRRTRAGAAGYGWSTTPCACSCAPASGCCSRCCSRAR